MHIVITGANRGIGLALTKNYRAQGHQVTAICRQSSPELEATEADIIEGIDVSNSEAPANIAAMVHNVLGDTCIDILINNAGILRHESLDNMDTQAIQAQFNINALAPLAITHALLPLLKSGSKIALITSRMGSIADNGSGNYYGYRMSKAALNAAGKSLAMDLKDQDINVAILHPGMVQTDMINHAGDISADTAAERLIARIAELTNKNTGTFWHANGEVLPW
ncbi:SDR family oxidoreductase [Marinagarivorans algicola]|uniref:SDR family oxidoreductase n=1 Tax=Marinagarivorans algicola TaxID=1513270 RepID=UPI0006B8AA25|nr:SDR family oxidoreductase [Marinagarivorans algicola]